LRIKDWKNAMQDENSRQHDGEQDNKINQGAFEILPVRRAMLAWPEHCRRLVQQNRAVPADSDPDRDDRQNQE